MEGEFVGGVDVISLEPVGKKGKADSTSYGIDGRDGKSPT